MPKKISTANNVKIKKPPFVFESTQAKLSELSAELGCPVLSYFKPPSGNIWSLDLYALLECLNSIGHVKKLALYVRSNGGSGMVSLRIINLLRSFTDKLIILAPSECASAATMLALGCDEIHMGPLSSLSPVDSSLTHALSPVDKLNGSVPVSLDELWRVLRLWKEAENTSQTYENPVANDLQKSVEFGYSSKKLHKTDQAKDGENPYKYLYEYIHPLVFGAVDRYSSLSVRLCQEILSYHLQDKEKVDSISRKLNYDYPAHGYPITLRDAKSIGLNVVEMSLKVQNLLHSLQLTYSELTEEQITDYDKTTFHDNSIYSLAETAGVQLVYQQDYDKYYMEAEKRHLILNDLSGWYKTVFKPKTKSLKADKEPFLRTKIYF